MASAKKPRYFLWIIMGLLVVGLLGFGTGGLSGNLRTVGEVGDKPITVIAYQRALNEQLRGFEAQVGTSVSFQQAQQFGLDQAALSQVVTRRTLDNEAAQLGISVGDERVRDEVLRVPAFGGIDGQFDRESYRFALQQSGLTETDFEMGIREEISRTLLQGAVVGGGRLGHGLGLTLTEWPSVTPLDTTELREGMVLTLEPGVEIAPGRIMVHEENIVLRAEPPSRTESVNTTASS